MIGDPFEAGAFQTTTMELVAGVTETSTGADGIEEGVATSWLDLAPSPAGFTAATL